MSKNIDEMTDDEVRFEIAKIKGYVKGKGRMDSAYYCNFDWWYTPTGGRTSCLPEWTYDIAVAMPLLEEMRPNFFDILLICHDYDDKWYCQCSLREGHDENIRPVTGINIKLPSAISRAYLKCKVGGESV